ncbi:MAG: hypothetical protein M1831_006841 [Alyxoria varia]|nr:MAG: hypothetical protein M1831_006841 [Alyxoria varia]
MRIPQAQQMNEIHSGKLEYTALDMKFLHYFILEGYPHMPFDSKSIWTKEVPMIAHSYDFLMHAVLALSAGQLVRNGDHSPVLMPAVNYHRTRAVVGVNNFMSKTDRSDDDNDALLSACYALAFQHACTGDGPAGFWITLRTITTVNLEIWGKTKKSRFGYLSYIRLYYLISMMTTPDFLRFTSPQEKCMQLLQRHLLSLQTLMRPILHQQEMNITPTSGYVKDLTGVEEADGSTATEDAAPISDAQRKFVKQRYTGGARPRSNIACEFKDIASATHVHPPARLKQRHEEYQEALMQRRDELTLRPEPPPAQHHFYPAASALSVEEEELLHLSQPPRQDPLQMRMDQYFGLDPDFTHDHSTLTQVNIDPLNGEQLLHDPGATTPESIPDSGTPQHLYNRDHESTKPERTSARWAKLLCEFPAEWEDAGFFAWCDGVMQGAKEGWLWDGLFTGGGDWREGVQYYEGTGSYG